MKKPCSREDVLIAEDDSADFELLGGIVGEASEELKLKAGRQYQFRNGEELLAHLWQRAEMPALILLDWRMPKMDGLDTLMALKSQPRLRDIPVVVFSGTISREDAALAMTRGALQAIPKPDRAEDRTHSVERLRTILAQLHAGPVL